MGAILVESELVFDFSSALRAKKFDDENHKMAHCMKAVDFTVEWENEFWLVEVKDPSASEIPSKYKNSAKKEFLNQLKDGNLFSKVLGPKCKDSFLYLHLSKALPDKPLKYFVMVAEDSLDKATLAHLTDRLKRSTCFAGPDNNAWPGTYLESVAVFNEATWNENLGQCQVKRSS